MKPTIAFLSTAHIHTKNFISNFLEAGDGRRIGLIWDDVPERGQRYAEMAGAPFEPDLQKALRKSALDGFIICAENTRHLPLLEKTLPLGKPVFCEKPLVTSTRDLGRVKNLLQQYSSTLFCGYFQPFGEAMNGVAKLMASGAMGRITRFRYRNAHHAAYGRWFDTPDLAWFAEHGLAGGGGFMDMGTHAIHLARTLFGPVLDVWATIENHSGNYPTVDDFGIAHLRFASGIMGTIEAGWTQTGGLGGLEVVGTEKTLWHDGQHYIYGAPNQPAKELPPGLAAPTRVDRLIAVLRGEIPQQDLHKDLEAILDSVAIMEACYASSQSGNRVSFKTDSFS